MTREIILPGNDNATSTALAETDPSADRHLHAFHAALADVANNPVDILCIGSSITEGGTVGQRADMWISQLRDQLRARWQPSGVAGGIGYIPVFNTSSIDDGWIEGGTLEVRSELGLGRRAYGLYEVGDSLEITVRCTGFTIFYGSSPGTGNMDVTVDGGTATTVDTSHPSGGTEGGFTYDSGALTAGDHTITITPTTPGTDIVRVEGLMVYEDDETSGIRVWESGRSGKGVAWWEGASLDLWYDSLETVNPDVVVCEFGTGDWSSDTDPAVFKSTVQDIVTEIQSRLDPDPSIVFLVYVERANGGVTYDWQDYVDALDEIAVADGGINIFDLRDRMGPVDHTAYGLFHTDNVHLSDKGSRLIGQALAEYLSP